MMYQLHQAQAALLARLRPLARAASGLLRPPHPGRRPETLPLAQAAAALQLLESAGTTHRKPAFGLTHARVGDKLVEVREEVVDTAPFGRLLRFAKDAASPGPRVLVVAPQSGHFATRLRGTVEALLPEHDVHVTDWTDAREIPVAAGLSAWTTWWRRSSPGWRRWGRARICSRCRSRPWRCWPPPR